MTGNLIIWTTVEEMLAGWPVVSQMYPTMSEDEYARRLTDCVTQDYRQIAYFDGTNQCRGVVGLWFFPRVWCGLQADIDNFVVDHSVRSQGIGKILLDECLRLASEQGARIVALDTYVDNPESHRFYFREGFTIRGYHFLKPLGDNTVW